MTRHTRQIFVAVYFRWFAPGGRRRQRILCGHRVTGFVDLGELGAADRWWDVAVGAWSVGWNFGVELEPLFYESYGIEPDPGRIRFFRLLYDLAS